MPNANRDKGLKFERDVARYFRDNGVATAERRVVESWRTKDRESADRGDTRGIPGICVQAKYVVDSHPKGLAGKALDDVMIDARKQARVDGAAIALVIEKRAGHADVGECWAHLPANVLAALLFGIDPYHPKAVWSTAPVRTELRHIIEHLVTFSEICAKSVA